MDRVLNYWLRIKSESRNASGDSNARWYVQRSNLVRENSLREQHDEEESELLESCQNVVERTSCGQQLRSRIVNASKERFVWSVCCEFSTNRRSVRLRPVGWYREP